MVFLEYPKWKYRGAEGVIVQDAAEEAALGGGWVDHPDDQPEDADVEHVEDAAPVKRGPGRPRKTDTA